MNLFFLLLISVLSAVLALIPVGDALAPINVDATGRFREVSTGRERIFHGINGVQKGVPWYPAWLLNDTLVDEIAAWGVTAVRVGWMWSGYEPREGVFNATYASMTRSVVDKLASRGIYTLLDTHQDALSSEFCNYDGIPLWNINKCKDDALFPFPWPYTGNCSSRSWGANELTEAEGACYQAIYSNKHNIRDSFVKFWTKSASIWRSVDAILGYELINEPFAGNVYRDPELFVPGVAAKRNLQPLYAALAEGIRTEDTEKLIFFEPVTWGMLLGGSVGCGFTEVPGGPAYANRSVLSFHYYCKSFSGPEPKPDVCAATADLVQDAIKTDIARIGGGAFLTEWGGCDGAQWLPECVKVMDKADKNLLSWTEYDGFGQGGAFPSAQYITALSRTYARAIAGTALNMTFVNATADFSFCYTLDTSILLPTEIFVPFRSRYNSLATVSCSPNLVPVTSIEHSLVTLTPISAARTGDVACVSIRRK